MNFQIKKLILWPKNTDYKFKEIEFELGAINIITGASRTGKSAIIPIIDYCLASGSCYIPVKTIRNACSWFGIVIQTENTQILLARREPGLQKSTTDMYIEEGTNVIIPEVPIKNSTTEATKKRLDELAALSFLEMESDSKNNYYGRPSFRDLMAFCFQPQNIVANSNTLFYKADTTEHRTKLINIFPYILGAVTPDILAKRQEINELVKELKRKERELLKLQDVSEKWKIEISGWLAAAEEFGLLTNTDNLDELSFEEQIEILSSLANKKAFDSIILKNNIEESSKEIVSLRKEENGISFKLSSLKRRYTEMTQLMESINDYRESLTIQVERLNISKWLKSLADGEHNCPICGKSNDYPQQQLKIFYKNLEKLEEETGYTSRIPAAFEREYENVRSEIQKLTEQLVAIQKRIEIQSRIRNSSEEEKYTLENIARFLGQVQYASETFEKLGVNSELKAEIETLNDRLRDLRSQVNENTILKRINTALRTIEVYVIKLIPFLDSERPNDPIKIDYGNLTVIVSGKDGRDDYLWEIGSGSNWLSYHISVTLGFHLF
ncbi:hypothetical protein N752_28095 [Desulforamulus aquiferis]|nr:DUF3732 domain-containing protein [Desulforamulus aquiferis]RYD01836.1 hypothetical protein N752_28095 [Desulforamulus aquiferis]